MGSARLGVARDSSVVDTHGECWDVQNLYVADAALMPTSTGAWPPLSVSLLKHKLAAQKLVVTSPCADFSCSTQNLEYF